MANFILTGASGFLGRQIIETLSGYSFITVSRTDKGVVSCDLSTEVPRLEYADTVIHAAGKAHLVPKTLKEEQDFYSVNVQGTINLLKALEQSPALPSAFVFISSVAVYGIETGHLITEDNPLLATDAYGRTKIQAEELIQHWCGKHQIRCTVLRLPLIAGPTPPGNLKTMIRGVDKGYYFNIAGGNARKSMVLATDVAQLLPKAAENSGVYNLTDGVHPSFVELSELIAKQLEKNMPSNIPHWIAKGIATFGDFFGSKAPLNSEKLRKITSSLTFDDSKARRELGWNPTPVLEGFRLL